MEVTCQFSTAQNKVVHYHAEFAPQGIQLGITAIDLHAGQVSGQATLTDDILHLDHLRGRAADGTVLTNGNVEFFHNDVGLNLAVDVDHIELDQLPREWSLPSEVSGHLTGHADFQTHLEDGRPIITGQGQGKIQDAQVEDFSTGPIPLVMTFDAQGFHFKWPSLEGMLGRKAARRAKE
ncbi:MAG: hypothetical protein JO112_18160 [Planctomycetes bacterium]|nr:hypothetical protein [Planctomycetota bacterium]